MPRPFPSVFAYCTHRYAMLSLPKHLPFEVEGSKGYWSMSKQLSFTSSNPKISAHGDVAVSGGGGNISAAGSGRASMDYQLPSGGSLTAGVSGSANVGRSGGRSYKNAQVDAVDLTYAKGRTSIGASFEPQTKRTMVRLTRKF